MPPGYHSDPDNPDPQIVLDDAVCRLDKNGRPLSGSLNQILCSRTPEPKPPAPQPDPDKPEPKPSPVPQPDPVSEDAVCRLDKNGKPLSGLLNQILCSRTPAPAPEPKPPAPKPKPKPPVVPAPQPEPPNSFKYCEDFFDSSTGFDWSKLFSDEFSTCVWKSKQKRERMATAGSKKERN
jgi:outer membrane biosynthesis protein TonB